ncbi:MAG: DNA repair protein RecN [Bacteroidia bacterium]
MLTHLYVKNYALIESLEIDFQKGLTIITGETGAGKSILLGALGLVIGQRADSQALRDKEQKCVVEVTFDIKGYKLKSFFKSNDLDYSDECVVRREINPAGNSRAFINDTPVTLPVLKELGNYLIDIHSQHETLEINSGSFQLSLVDAVADNVKLLTEYQQLFTQYKSLQKQLVELKAQEEQSKKDFDYYSFLYNELEEAAINADELKNAEEELETLNNAEEIQSNLIAAANILSEGELNTLNQFAEIKNLLNNAAKHNAQAKELADRVTSLYIELKELSREITAASESITADPEKAQMLSDKLDTYHHLLQKHRVATAEELIQIKNELESKLQFVTGLDTEIAKLESAIQESEKELLQQAEEISKRRNSKLQEIEKSVSQTLSALGMPNAVLKINCQKLDKLNESGLDSVQFLFSANKGSEPKELGKVASGGELSRLMLSLKAMLAKVKTLPTIIFDEIDTGVSGEIAYKIGSIMEEMAKHMQVITITHLPQIASKGKVHLKVYKQDKGDITHSSIKQLSKDERVEEIAHMLSGDKITDVALQNAKSLLSL